MVKKYLLLFTILMSSLNGLTMKKINKNNPWDTRHYSAYIDYITINKHKHLILSKNVWRERERESTKKWCWGEIQNPMINGKAILWADVQMWFFVCEVGCICGRGVLCVCVCVCVCVRMWGEAGCYLGLFNTHALLAATLVVLSKNIRFYESWN